MQFLPPASILVLLLASPASAARCIGSSDPVVERMELAIGRDPAAAVDLISEAIAETAPANRRRLAELYFAKSQALNMSGSPSKPPLEKARSIAGPFAPTDNLGIYLRITEAAEKADAAEVGKALQSIIPDYEALPDGSRAKTCRATDLAFFNSLIERPLEAMTFATQAYRNADDDTYSIERAQATSILAYLVMAGQDFDYANELHSEAYAIQRELGLSDLAANELLVWGYSYLARDEWKSAVTHFEASAREAHSSGNQYAVDYAQLGLCEANLEGKMIEQAAPACERAYEGLGMPGERMAFPAATLMARLLVEQGNPARALEILDPLMADTEGDTPSLMWIMALETRAQALSLSGRNEEAYLAMREAREKAQEYNDRELRGGVAALRARFQTEELQRRLAAEERASDARMRLAIAVIAGAVTTLALLGTLIFFLLRHRRRFRHLAMTDPLTGLANRRATLEKVDEALRIAGPPQPLASFALIDIDHFKWCNDTFGHDAGDKILNQFARVVERCIRPSDIVGRWGGEEFLVILPEIGLDEAARIIERVRTEAAREEFDFAPGYRLRFSAGIAMPGETDGLTDACIKLADRRLYAAKHKGRNRTCIAGGQVPADVPEQERQKRASDSPKTSVRAA